MRNWDANARDAVFPAEPSKHICYCFFGELLDPTRFLNSCKSLIAQRLSYKILLFQPRSYDIIKNRLNESLNSGRSTSNSGQKEDTFAVYFASGMLAEAVACIIYVPVDVVKERMQVQSSANSSTRLLYKSSWDALVTISKQECLVGIYKGYAATLTSFGPFSALYFVFYEGFKSRSREY